MLRSPAPAIAAAPPPTLVEVAYRRLREDIIEGRRSAGERLRVEHLREEYGLGATPLREALSRLSSEQLVESIGQRGFRVASMSLDELADITEMRVLLEGQALAQSLARGTLEWEARVVAAHHTLSKLDHALKGGDRPSFSAWEAKNQELHDALVDACGSPWLLRMRRVLYDQHQRYRWMSIEQKIVPRDVAREHKAIVDAALARDVARACELTAEHIRETARVIERVVGPKLGSPPRRRASKK
ncbi:MAG: FCD domain-containing protein [Labilithrix sp.]|nr:FCD domain-containing protein [Labilithrix sp.]